MAAYLHSRVGPADPSLPQGPCDFRDLTRGSDSPLCECKRFWLDTSQRNSPRGNVERACCCCGHHACFHDAVEPPPPPPQQSSHCHNGTRMSGVQATRNSTSDPLAAPAGYIPAQQCPVSHLGRPTGLGIRPDSSAGSQSIGPRLWDALNQFARTQAGGGASDTSKLPSTASPSFLDDARPVRDPPLRHDMRPGLLPSVTGCSPIKVDTLSMTSTPELRAPMMPSDPVRPMPNHGRQETMSSSPRAARQALGEVTPRVCDAQQVEETLSITTPSGQLVSLVDIRNLLQAHGRRLDNLESISFSHVPPEELQDRFDQFDSRMLDLEQWRIDHGGEHRMLESSDRARRRLSPVEGASFGSDVSFDSHAAAHTEAVVMATLATSSVTHPRIEALESRVTDLEHAAPPSCQLPWQVQVVLLPWGRDLRGIWFLTAEATRNSLAKSTTQMTEEWTGSQSAPKLSFTSATDLAWTTESIGAWANETSQWLSPKACGPRGTVFSRLASRGFVKDIMLTAADSRHVQNAVRHAFGHLSTSPPDHESGSPNSFQALREMFVPLRKVRKSARLRFLSPAEMVTSATWTAGHLDSSVFMKVTRGQRRLYVTTPDAYLQPTGDGWSWAAIRSLPPCSPPGREPAIEAAHLAVEACWTYNEQLDRKFSSFSSMSHASTWSISSPPAHEAKVTEPLPNLDSSRLSDDHCRRTVSLPGSTINDSGANTSPELPKRRVASFEPSGLASAPPRPIDLPSKRRRISASHEAERRGVNFTPRRSREPPSPLTASSAALAAALAVAPRSPATASSRPRRGNTPFDYATPHSNNYSAVTRVGRDGEPDDDEGPGVDAGAGSELPGGRSERGDDEWEGMDDDGLGDDDGDDDGDEEDERLDS